MIQDEVIQKPFQQLTMDMDVKSMTQRRPSAIRCLTPVLSLVVLSHVSYYKTAAKVISPNVPESNAPRIDPPYLNRAVSSKQTRQLTYDKRPKEKGTKTWHHQSNT